MHVFDGKTLNFHFWNSLFSGIAVRQLQDQSILAIQWNPCEKSRINAWQPSHTPQHGHKPAQGKGPVNVAVLVSFSAASSFSSFVQGYVTFGIYMRHCFWGFLQKPGSIPKIRFDLNSFSPDFYLQSVRKAKIIKNSLSRQISYPYKHRLLKLKHEPGQLWTPCWHINLSAETKWPVEFPEWKVKCKAQFTLIDFGLNEILVWPEKNLGKYQMLQMFFCNIFCVVRGISEVTPTGRNNCVANLVLFWFLEYSTCNWAATQDKTRWRPCRSVWNKTWESQWVTNPRAPSGDADLMRP